MIACSCRDGVVVMVIGPVMIIGDHLVATLPEVPGQVGLVDRRFFRRRIPVR